MQTLSVQIQDDYMQQFMDFVKNSHSNIIITKDKNLELDPYFYERKKELQKIRDDIKNGKTTMIDNETFWNDIEKHIETL
ncbi:MAG: hypothetical protein ACQESH_03805 [Campylobacterota bacterium]